MDKSRCLKCQEEIGLNDNFCWKCGHWTPKAYAYYKDAENIKIISEGKAIRQSNNQLYLMYLLALLIIIFIGISTYRKNDLFRPYYYLEKQILKYKYGYNVSLFNTNNQYFNKNIENKIDALNIIKDDLNKQDYKCSNNPNIWNIEEEIKNKYDIPAVNFCDMPYEEAIKIKQVIEKIYDLFPNIKGYLTNISITNPYEREEYLAYFQPIYQFVNSNNDINNFNKVNKTQILLNSYYYLNNEMLKTSLNQKVDEGWYVKNANWESQLAHEFGHYITFVALQKNNNIDSLMLETKENKEQINTIINIVNSGEYSKSILKAAYENYMMKYDGLDSLEEFALKISKYAGFKDKYGNLIADEVIAEAVHDYYLNGNNAAIQSLEIINEIRNRL